MFLEEKNLNSEAPAAKPKAAFGSLRHFIEWLERQDPSTTYHYCSGDCLHARYNKAHRAGYSVPVFIGKDFRLMTDRDKIELACADNSYRLRHQPELPYSYALERAKRIEGGDRLEYRH